MTPAASGTQHTLRSGDYEGVIASVGASTRVLRYGERDLIVPFAADEVRPAFRGATLAPWPNRVVDGIYHFDGTQRQLPLTEPARGHALHGLVVWSDFTLIDKGSDHVSLSTTIQPQTAYPWRIKVTTAFTLDESGLTQSVTALNLSESTAPWGTAPHPYLVAGAGEVDDWTLELPASKVLEVTDERLLPTELRAVEIDATRFDFRAPRRIAQERIDHAFTDLKVTGNGITAMRLTSADGTGVAMIWDRTCQWVQIHTADNPTDPSHHRRGLAVEPMTCAPDAFNASSYRHDVGLVRLGPGQTSTASWKIEAIN